MQLTSISTIEHPALFTPDSTFTQHYNTTHAALQTHVHTLHTFSCKETLQRLQPALQHSSTTNTTTIMAQTLQCTNATTLSSNAQQQHLVHLVMTH